MAPWHQRIHRHRLWMALSLVRRAHLSHLAEIDDQEVQNRVRGIGGEGSPGRQGFGAAPQTINQLTVFLVSMGMDGSCSTRFLALRPCFIVHGSARAPTSLSDADKPSGSINLSCGKVCARTRTNVLPRVDAAATAAPQTTWLTGSSPPPSISAGSVSRGPCASWSKPNHRDTRPGFRGAS